MVAPLLLPTDLPHGGVPVPSRQRQWGVRREDPGDAARADAGRPLHEFHSLLRLLLPTQAACLHRRLPLLHAVAAADGIARISILPDDLLHKVLSRLPAKDGARTTVLSSRWRSLWRSVPLVLVDTHFLAGGDAECRPARAGATSRAVTDAVSAALKAHPGPFPFVSLTCIFLDRADGRLLDRWSRLLATKGVEELVLVNRPSPVLSLPLPSQLFSCVSLRRLYIGAWAFPETDTFPRGVAFPNLKELVLGFVVVQGNAIDFMLAVSPVLETLSVVGNVYGLHARLTSRSLRSAQFCLSWLEEVAVVDAPSLERLFIWKSDCDGDVSMAVKIHHAPQLRLLGYLGPGAQDLEIGNTIIKAGTKPRPVSVVSSVHTLALTLHFGVRGSVEMLPSLSRCFPASSDVFLMSRPSVSSLKRKLVNPPLATSVPSFGARSVPLSVSSRS